MSLLHIVRILLETTLLLFIRFCACAKFPINIIQRGLQVYFLAKTTVKVRRKRIDSLNQKLVCLSFCSEKLKSGTTVIIDRYAFSGVAFSAAKGLDLDWCKVRVTEIQSLLQNAFSDSAFRHQTVVYQNQTWSSS